jgi:phosphatidylethanolamine/phosphatidyl-N-methylethanolamine N-methyltransferase
MEEKSTRTIYDVWAHFYDLIWLPIVHRRSRKALEHMELKPGDKVLDVGIGTGLALSVYPNYVSVTGIDLSEGMLQKARKRMQEKGMDSVHLALANALELPFEENGFDQVVLSHVVTVVSDPIELIKETKRVTKPGGKIIITNHFQSSNRFIAKLERMICPITEHLGWKSDLCFDDFIREAGLEVDYRYKLDQVDLFQTIFITNKLPEEKQQRTAAA